MKSPELSRSSFIKALSIENKIFIFLDDCPNYICYNVDKKEWSEEPCKITETLEYFSCVKVPCL